MQLNDKVAFGSRAIEIAMAEGIKFAQPILAKMASMALDYFTNRPPWLPSDTEIDTFVRVLSSEAPPMVRETLQRRLLTIQERRMAANYSNKLPINQIEFYLAAAERRLLAEEGDSYNPQAFVDLFLFLCNKRRIHDGN